MPKLIAVKQTSARVEQNRFNSGRPYINSKAIQGLFHTGNIVYELKRRGIKSASTKEATFLTDIGAIGSDLFHHFSIDLEAAGTIELNFDFLALDAVDVLFGPDMGSFEYFGE